MDMIITLALLAILMVVLVYLSGWFSGSETALTNLTVAQIAGMKQGKDGNPKTVDRILFLKKNMDRALVAILIGNNIVNILLSATAALVANSLFQTLGVTVAVGVITFLLIIFGEITPKSHAIADSQGIARKRANTLYHLVRALGPIISLFIALSRGIIRMVGGKERDVELVVSDDGIKNLATLGELEGVIKPIERDIIHKVFKFGDCKISDVMVPIKDVFRIEKDIPMNEARKTVLAKGFTRVPFIKQKRVLGIVYTKNLLEEGNTKISGIMKKPMIVGEERDITDVFHRMKRSRVHMAVVKNSRGEHVGIVTLEDILEELVGEIEDEFHERKFHNGS